ncbi:MAG: hypothetical protein BGO41_11365 [Clostridiales bacterium 38-18]|mgnify:CR=1 FL=1|nr:MAG: hypothetical protein BGO41_11365 [Clostridiales bacterium 38-18]
MSDKLEILKMIESGKISVDEGLQMIEALEQTERIDEDVREELYSDRMADNTNIESEIYGETIRTSEFKNFDVSLVTCKLNVERSNVDDVTIEILDNHTREYVDKPEWLHLNEEHNTISIKEKRTSNLTDIFDFFKSGSGLSKSVYINVKLPLEMVIDKGKFSNVSGSISLLGVKSVDLEARSVSGKVYAGDIKTQTLQLKSTSGSVTADNVKAAKLYLNSTSGKVKLNGNAHLVEAKSVSGTCELQIGAMLTKLKTSTVSGSLKMYLAEPEVFNLKFNTVSGGIDTNGFAIVDKSSSSKKSVQIDNRSKDHYIEASTVSGKIVIDKF